MQKRCPDCGHAHICQQTQPPRRYTNPVLRMNAPRFYIIDQQHRTMISHVIRNQKLINKDRPEPHIPEPLPVTQDEKLEDMDAIVQDTKDVILHNDMVKNVESEIEDNDESEFINSSLTGEELEMELRSEFKRDKTYTPTYERDDIPEPEFEVEQTTNPAVDKESKTKKQKRKYTDYSKWKAPDGDAFEQ